MNRRSLPVAAALAATAALLLTACGGSDHTSKSNDKIPGADTGDQKSSPSPSASADNSAGRPKIALPGDVHDVFDGWKTGDPKTDPVLADAGRTIDATNYAITQGNPNEPALGFYYKGDALVGAAQWVKQGNDAGVTLTGTTRYFNPKVDVYAANRATLSYCSFEGKAYAKNRKTNKVEKDPVTNNSYVLYVTRLEKNGKGVWQTSIFKGDRGNKACRP
ncbi:hypothetical protein [Streptomyces olivochromogenes]|uniref:hypothetical protein n=1 Tax=Streptomyces olivochromogenes TaxID=1963 RepID=UPI001F350CD1|nr:hypothetical protein [Streptomyces olivochromogenes]MCF3136073.1 hypothetical protein [Streptomyces olivochromogenes]